MQAKKRMRHISTLEDLFKGGKLHPDYGINQQMMVAGEVWHRFAIVCAQEAGPQAIVYSERVSTSRTRMDVDRYFADLVDTKKTARLCRNITSDGGRKILDAVILEDLTIADAALKLRGNAEKPARDEIRTRFKQALEDFARLARVLGARK